MSNPPKLIRNIIQTVKKVRTVRDYGKEDSVKETQERKTRFMSDAVYDLTAD